MNQEIYSFVLACFQPSFRRQTLERTSHFSVPLDFIFLNRIYWLVVQLKLLRSERNITGGCYSHLSDPDLNLRCWNDIVLINELEGCHFLDSVS